MKKKFKRIILAGIVLALLAFFSIMITQNVVEKRTEGKTFDTAGDMPHNKVGLLLGTGKYLSNGYINLYYQYRINAAEELYKSGKIEYILVSGDNSTKTYDEPSTIKDDLVALGIPADKIILDYAGFRTLDSVVRCREVFGQESITVISQEFHNKRAIFIANYKGITAVGFNARDVDINYGMKTMIRERLALVKMLLDLVFGKQPKFLGEKILIE